MGRYRLVGIAILGALLVPTLLSMRASIRTPLELGECYGSRFQCVSKLVSSYNNRTVWERNDGSMFTTRGSRSSLISGQYYLVTAEGDQQLELTSVSHLPITRFFCTTELWPGARKIAKGPTNYRHDYYQVPFDIPIPRRPSYKLGDRTWVAITGSEGRYLSDTEVSSLGLGSHDCPGLVEGQQLW